MTTHKLENYDIGGVWLYIEDMLDGNPPDEHFFFDIYGKPETRYMCWAGGREIGNAPSLYEARLKLLAYAHSRLTDQRVELERKYTKVRHTLVTMDVHEPTNLARFSVPLDWNPARAAQEEKERTARSETKAYAAVHP